MPDHRTTDWIVRPVGPDDRPAWEALYAGYGEFYELPMDRARLELVWSWLQEGTLGVQGLVVSAGPDAEPVGLAHYRPFARPLHGSVGCFLDDLFVAPGARGGGAVEALLGELRRRARAAGWDVIRWITREDNARARTAYDRIATRTPWVTYDLPPAPDPAS